MFLQRYLPSFLTILCMPLISFGQFLDLSPANSSSFSSHVRHKRQWSYPQQQPQICPPQCFACAPMQCQAYQCVQPQMAQMVRCCCRPVIIVRPQTDIKTACDGEEAVAMCMNGLCGQGYFCSNKKFCCRCPTGKSIGKCINGLCPAGYVCNSNDYCCAAGSGSAIGPCSNGQCPDGYECGEGDLCYARNGASSATSSPIRNYPFTGRIKQRPRWTPTIRRRGTSSKKTQQQRRARWWERRNRMEAEEPFGDEQQGEWEWE